MNGKYQDAWEKCKAGTSKTLFFQPSPLQINPMRIKSIQKLENVDCSWNRNVKKKKIETEDDGIKLGTLPFLHSRNIQYITTNTIPLH